MVTKMNSLFYVTTEDSSVGQMPYTPSSASVNLHFDVESLLVRMQRNAYTLGACVTIASLSAKAPLPQETNPAISFWTGDYFSALYSDEDIFSRMMTADIKGYFNPLTNSQNTESLRAMQSLEEDVNSYLNCLAQQSPFFVSAELDKLAEDVLNSLDSAETEDIETRVKSLTKDLLKFSD